MSLAAGRLSAVGSGQHLGSVFAVTRHLALTSLHCLRDGGGAPAISRVRCAWPHETSDATVQAWDESIDVALLRLSRMLPSTLDPIPLSGDVASNEPFVAQGAPATLRELDRAAVNGLVIEPNAQMPDGSPGIELLCFPAMAGMPLDGLSGAPVLTGSLKKAVGLIRWSPRQAEHPERSEGALAYAVPARQILERWPELAPDANLLELMRHLVDRRRRPDAHDVHADVRTLLLAGVLHLNEDDLRVIPGPDGGRSRLVAIDKGHAIIGVEPDLSHTTVLAVAEGELADAASKRTAYADQRYAAVLTDGLTWRLYHVLNGQLHLLDKETADPRAPKKLLSWLEAILATGRNIAPDRDVIEGKLGSSSPSYKLDAAELTAIYQTHRELPTVKTKRRMWAKLLTTASGISFADEDSLFIDHTLLVATAKVIGHAVLKFPLEGQDVTAAALMSGTRFSQAQITGAIEADFFDWVTEVSGGAEFVMNLAHRLARFEWQDVDHDVLKQLYESVIPQATRHQLGEYYTPDWLAQAIIAESAQEPLHQRVLDASCGSGTFLFHAIKAYLTAAEAAGMTSADAVNSVATHVIGIDVHPVAVTLARITYLLALSNRYLHGRSSGFTVPVFLGDSMRWGQETNLLTYDYKGLSVSTQLDPESFVTGAAAPSQPEFSAQLNFPDRIVAETDRFDRLVTRLADLATAREPDDPIPSLAEIFRIFEISNDEKPILQHTFQNMCKLHDDDEDHIWGYYVRNLARPAWLAQPGNQVDVLIGNPPWLVYRYMTGRQKFSFKKMTTERRLWAGGSAATNQDLAALFVTRCIQLYLRPGGHFGYVMPWAVLPRPGQNSTRPHAGFRTGNYPTSSDVVKVAFTQTWDLHRVKPSFFPLSACVVFGRRQQAGEGSVALPERAKSWVGRFDTRRAIWADAEHHISILAAEDSLVARQPSPYALKFAQGATVLPRFLFLVKPGTVSPLGMVANQRAVCSLRRRTEKKPWINLPDLTGAVEEKFIRPIYLGESVMPFRCKEPLQAIIPWDGQHLLRDGDLRLDHYPGLQDWLHRAEVIWSQHSSQRLSLAERLDYRRGITQQFPIAEHRVVYGASGAYLAAAYVADPSAIVEHKLYWAPTASRNEARYLTAILNSSVLTMAVRPMQARGEHNPRDFDKYVFQLPIPRYDPNDAAHARLVILAEHAEQVAAAVTLPEVRFERQRKNIRDTLDRDGTAADIDSIVKALLDVAA
jgi:SAM-dependent methyltransferase